LTEYTITTVLYRDKRASPLHPNVYRDSQRGPFDLGTVSVCVDEKTRRIANVANKSKNINFVEIRFGG
jgi:hypothetical protein